MLKINKLKNLFNLFLVLLVITGSNAQTVTISGYLFSKDEGQPLIGEGIINDCSQQRIFSNSYGYFAISLPSGQPCSVIFTAKNFVADTFESIFLRDTQINVYLKKEAVSMKTIEIIGNTGLTEVKSTKISSNTVKPRDVKYLPSLGGELDIIKVVQLLPGVQKGMQGQSGFQVRGGDADQNLILLDEATVYNVSHLFGFFSVFIPESIEDMQIYKGGFPSEYGGRLSSILDIRMKDGNNQKFSGSGGIGLLSSRITLEGPLIKNKSSFIISARRTYIDRVLKLVGVPLPYYFYDMNAKFNYEISKKSKLFYSFYYGNDVMKFKSTDTTTNDSGQFINTQVKFGFQLGNMTNTLRLNHIFSPKLFSNTSLIYTRFKYNVTGEFGGSGIYIGSQIYDLGIKQDLTYYRNKNNTLRFGFNVINHVFKPNIISASGDISDLIKRQTPPKINNLETGLFIRNEQTIGKFKVNYGLRMSGTLTENTFFAGLEPRLAAAWDITKYGALKFGYARMKQYLHMVSSSTVALPTDLWYPVTKIIKPQKSDQFTLGYQHLLKKLGLVLSSEIYYKTMQNLTEYKEGAVLILNNNYEKELLQGRGDAYGFEAMVRKDKGRLYGWISYTLGHSNRYFDNLNGGDKFPAKYDRRHNLAIVANFKLSRRWEISTVWNYLSGSKFTAQVGQYFQPKPGLNGVDIVPIYTKRNAVSMSPSHRLDLNFVWKGKTTAKYRAEWYFSAYNFYNRTEPYSIRIKVDDKGSLSYEQPGLFGLLLSIAYNFYF